MDSEGTLFAFWAFQRKINKIGPDKFSPDIIDDKGKNLRTLDENGI